MRTTVEEAIVIWLTGLSGSGKTTLGTMLTSRLTCEGHIVELLDGDELRAELSPDLGFGHADRDLHIKRIGYLTLLLSRNGVTVIVAAISPYKRARDKIRTQSIRFIEVHVDCSVSVLIARDTKGLYQKAIRGEIDNFTGISDPYEPPSDPEVYLETSQQSPDSCCEMIMAAIRKQSTSLSPIEVQ